MFTFFIGQSEVVGGRIRRKIITKQEKMEEISSSNDVENLNIIESPAEVTSTTTTTEDGDDDDVVEVVGFKLNMRNLKSEQENVKTKIKIKVLDEEQEFCLNTKIQKPISQITLADVKNAMTINWRHIPNFKKSGSPPDVGTYSYSARNEDEDGQESWDMIDDDFEILPSFQNIIEVKCIL